LVVTSKVDMPARRCHMTYQLPSDTKHCCVIGEKVWQRRSTLVGCSKVTRQIVSSVNCISGGCLL
ncbi:hypothetical protein J6590_097381, partial [Homalodisca vitripennis]